MNRLVAPPSASAPSLLTPSFSNDAGPGQTLRTYENNRFQWRGEPSPLVTFAPTHYEPGYAYPLVVWLHGADQSEHDLPEVMANVSTRNYVAVAPQATGESQEPWRQTAQGITDSEERILSAIESASDRFSVNPRRIFLAGHGCGGTTAWRTALASPHRFAGAASFDGPAPRGHSPLMRIKSARHLPLMLAFGDCSERYPMDEVCQDLRLFHSAGMGMKLLQEPGDGDLTTSMLAELDRWMMSVVCGSSAVSCEVSNHQ